MLGRDLACVFRDLHPLLWDTNELDITNRPMVARRIREVHPEIIINAAAYTDVDAAESEPERARVTNGHAVGYLAEAASRVGACLVHYSTDYVFDGKNPKGYTEDNKPIKPINRYGKSKQLGERLLIEESKRSGLKYFLIRTSWLFGPLWKQKRSEKNFVGTMLRLAAARDEIRVVDDQFGCPTLTLDLARATRALLVSCSPGVYHVTNKTAEKGITWHQFAKKILEFSGEQCRLTPCRTREFPRPAPRPPKFGAP